MRCRRVLALFLNGVSPSLPPSAADNPTSCDAPPPAEKAGVKVITTLEELDAQLVLVDEAGQRSDDELRKALASFEFGLTQKVPSDPYGEAYRKQQHELYLTISGASSYTPQNERSEFLGNMEETARQPFPYYTRSAQTVGDQLMALGYIIKTMNLASGSKILEFGPGWGNTTIALARMGYAVTAVDIEPKFLELIQCRAKLLGLSVQTVCASFGPVNDASGEPEKFDAVLFFESFHHCADHLKLIRELPTMLKDGGIAVFASEPITEVFPLPWGVRLDGMSVWSIRRFKWLELGFKESYFLQTMKKNGWTVTKHVCPETHLGVIFVAKRDPDYAIEKLLFCRAALTLLSALPCPMARPELRRAVAGFGQFAVRTDAGLGMHAPEQAVVGWRHCGIALRQDELTLPAQRRAEVFAVGIEAISVGHQHHAAPPELWPAA